MSEPKIEYLLRIVYKSGYTHDFWVSAFSFGDGTYEWVAVDPKNKPVMLGANDIAAVWQIGQTDVHEAVKE